MLNRGTSTLDAQQKQSQDVQLAQTKQCKLCQKDIELAKFRIHDAMCSRINYRCQKCDQLVQKFDKQLHDSEVCGKPQEESSADCNDKANVAAMMKASPTMRQPQLSVPIQQNKLEEEKEQQVDPSSLVQQEEAMNIPVNDTEANEREIQRILQEEMNQIDALQFQGQQDVVDANLPMTNYEKSKLKTAMMREQYGDDPDLWPEGVRPADQSKEQQLIGGVDEGGMHEHQDYEGNVFGQADEYGGINRIAGDIMGTFAAATNMVAKNLFPAQQPQRPNSSEGLHAADPNGFDAQQTNVNRQESQPVPQQLGDDADEIKIQSETEALEEQMLREIMEESLKQM